jgi:hypothetical protein
MERQGLKQLAFWAPQELHEKLKQVAKAERRSLSGQVIVILEDWLAEQGESETVAAE